MFGSAMYAVVKTGGKQYRVAADDVIKVERLDAGEGELVTLDDVLMVGGDDGVKIGSPRLAGAAVKAEVLEQAKGPKLVIFKKRRRKNSRRKTGHRQQLTVLRIKDIAVA
jgi:large subunit ribosomal protein L21